MKDEDAGGECKFDSLLSSKLCLLPVSFGARKNVGNEMHFHSFSGEALAASFGIFKNRHCLWGRPFTLISDCKALLWLMSYEGHNHAVRRLKLELLGFCFTIANRPERMMKDADYFSQLNKTLHLDPLLYDYLTFSKTAYSQFPPNSDKLSQNNICLVVARKESLLLRIPL